MFIVKSVVTYLDIRGLIMDFGSLSYFVVSAILLHVTEGTGLKTTPDCGIYAPLGILQLC